jgi:hypothetical protein
VKFFDSFLLRLRGLELSSINPVLVGLTARFQHVSAVKVITTPSKTLIQEKLVVIVAELGAGKAKLVVIAALFNFASVSEPLTLAVGALRVTFLAIMHPRH